MNATLKSALGLMGAAMLAASCTVTKQDAPPLTGPAEFGTSVTIEATPDVLPTDGGSQARVTITVRDHNGQPAPNRTLRVETFVDGAPADFGTLSARSVVTNSQGQAVVTYTAPAVNTGGVDPGLTVSIAATPLGTDAANAIPRTTVVRLVPVGTVVGPAGLVADFTFTPANPTIAETVVFDATRSSAPLSNPIAQYRWEFGDGTVLFGPIVSKTFMTPGSIAARLTVSDAMGRSVTNTKSVTVADLGTAPFAIFDFSPEEPVVNQTIFFTAARSTVPTGRTIASYEWDFGNGQRASGRTATTAYDRAGTYNVVLTIVDDLGRRSSSTKAVTIE